MRSAVEFYGYLTPVIQAAVAGMAEIMDHLPDNGDRLWSCHAVTRGFKATLDLPFGIEEGFFASRGTDHAWFTAMAPGNSAIVVDVLPMGAHGGPFVVDGSRMAPWGKLYIEMPGYYDDRLEAFDAEGALFAAAIREYASAPLERARASIAAAMTQAAPRDARPAEQRRPEPEA